ncbi:hypothetical protein A4G18_02070 [Pasteurellaceae bacterium Pebbles2]|nr:hypothetical protein [Pasteurellaceae bacterium Pebbles2]
MKKFIILLIYSAILLASEQLYRFTFNITLIPIQKLVENFGFLFLIISVFYFAKYKFTKIMAFLFFAIAMLGNNVNYEIYRSWLNGINYYLAFAEYKEVISASTALLGKLALPITWAVIDILIFSSILLIKKETKTYRFPIIDSVFFALLIYISARSAISKAQDNLIAPKEYYGKVKLHYLAFGNLVGKVIPNEVFGISNVAQYYHPKPNKIDQPAIKNIILIMGESEAASHVSSFGYSRQTTPFFDQITANSKQQTANSNAILKQTYSAGTLTFISLPPFFNAIPYPNGQQQMLSGNTNLFNLAQEQGYKTYFYTAQAEEQMSMMNILGKRWIDDLRFPEQLGFTENMPDENLLPLFYQIDLDNQANFIVLHQRASHQPYGKFLQEKDHIFGNEELLDRYDNTIYKTDLFIKSVFDYLQKREQDDWLLIYTSDHGQYVTKEIINQGTIIPDSYIVPLFAYSPNLKLGQQMDNVFSRCEKSTHQQLSTFLINTFGYDMEIADCAKNYINVNGLSGDFDYLEVIQPDQINLISPEKK